MGEVIRVFIAIKLSSQVQDELRLIGQQLIKRGVHGIRWVKPENIHLTIQFLGDISKRKLNDIIIGLNEASNLTMRFRVHIGGMGAFPHVRKPRVLWIGVDAPLELLDLHRNIKRGLEKIEIQTDGKVLRPHLTIGRVKRDASRHSLEIVSDMVENYEISTVGEQMVESIHLIESKLRPTGPIYKALAVVKLEESSS